MVHSLAQAIRRVPWWVWLIALVALVPRLLLVPFGLPYELDPDEQVFVDAAWQMVANGDGDPGWYSHPASTYLDALAALFVAYGAAGVLTGTFDSLASVGEAHHADVSHLYIIGRLVSAISGLAAVLMTYAVARKLRISPFWATTAALLMAVSFPMIQFSAQVRGDMLMIALLLVTIMMSLRALISPTIRRFALAGVALGLAAASKYPGALGVVPLVAANATLTVQQRVTPRRGLMLLAVSAAAGAVAALVVGPYLFLHVGDTLHQIGLETTRPGDDQTGVLGDLWRYLSEALPSALGMVATILGLAGLVAMLSGRRARIVSVTFWAFLVSISALTASWERWALPLLPLAAIGAVWLLGRLQLRYGSRLPETWTTVVAVAVAGILLWSPLTDMLAALPSYVTGDDTRLQANEWAYDNIPAGSTLLVESYTLQVASDDYDIRIAQSGEIMPWTEYSDQLRPSGYFGRIANEWFGSVDELMAEIETADVDYVALSDTWIDLYRDHVDEYPPGIERYEAMLEAYREVARFDGESASLGSPVTILEVTGQD